MENTVARLRRRERDRVTIVAEILEMARDGVLKSNIMWRAGLSYTMLNGYVGLMMDARLLDRVLDNNKVVFKTTGRGMEFLYHCQEIIELLEPANDKNRSCRKTQPLPSNLTARLIIGRCQ